jgi:hypothetical protein
MAMSRTDSTNRWTATFAIRCSDQTLDGQTININGGATFAEAHQAAYDKLISMYGAAVRFRIVALYIQKNEDAGALAVLKSKPDPSQGD